MRIKCACESVWFNEMNKPNSLLRWIRCERENKKRPHLGKGKEKKITCRHMRLRWTKRERANKILYFHARFMGIENKTFFFREHVKEKIKNVSLPKNWS